MTAPAEAPMDPVREAAERPREVEKRARVAGQRDPDAEERDPDAEERAPVVEARLRALGSPENVEGMKRFGVGGARSFGVRMPDLRRVARDLGKDHALALALWESGWRETRLVAAMIDPPSEVTREQMERWALDIDSWEICDGVCNELFRRVPWAWDQAIAWSRRQESYVKRAGYVLMAQLAVHDKEAADYRFLALLPEIERGACDDRNEVRKGVNWALRQIGKRNLALHSAAMACAESIREQGSRSARWIASDALRELRSDAVVARLRG